MLAFFVLSLVVLAAVFGAWVARGSIVRERDALAAKLLAAEGQRDQAERLASSGRIAAGLAHELGNPLCAIANYTHTLETKVAPDARPLLTSLRREVARIERLMDGFIAHATPRAADPRADVTDSLRETLSFLGDQGVFRRITVSEDLDGSPLPVAASTVQLEQLFANLLLNAADAMPGGGALWLWNRRDVADVLLDSGRRRSADVMRPSEPTERVAINDAGLQRAEWRAAHAGCEVVKIVVADSGHGVRHGDEERIFEPFVTTKGTGKGTGLGLAIVRRMVDELDGLIWVQRSREGGAAFHLVLPVKALATIR
jgi:signal transduction histidine kinase